MSPLEPPASVPTAAQWPFLLVLGRMGLAVALGVFVGLEREHSGKTGVRTFALVAMLGCLAGLANDLLIWVAMAGVLVLVVLMNWREMAVHGKVALTTSVALLVVAFCGVLSGQGHVFTPVVAGVSTAALLAWKEPIAGFASGLTDKELQAAILLAILSLVVYPVLPAQPVDPWGLLEPQANWASVIIIAAIGFVNYVLLRLLGPRGMELTAFFGGLVNSRKVIVELLGRLRANQDALLPVAFRAVALATGAMAIRNVLIVLAVAPESTGRCLLPLGGMAAASAVLWRRGRAAGGDAAAVPSLALESPFRLSAALQFGLIFSLLNVAGALAQRNFGAGSFYFVSAAGGLMSSASSIASAATLMHRGEVATAVGINGIVLSSVTSILINIPLVRQFGSDAGFRRRATWALLAIAAIGLAGLAGDHLVARYLPWPRG